MKRTVPLIALIALVATACSSPDDRVSRAIGNALRDQNAQEVRIAALTDFEWDKLYLFDPYTPRSEICKVLGVQVKNCESVVPFESENDGVMSIAFLSGTRVVRYSRHIRWNGDFTPSPGKQPIPASRAIFRVHPTGEFIDDKPWLKLVLNEA
jgi:hypothetical protein